MTPPTLTTERLVLTALAPRFFEAHRATMTDPRVTSMIGTGQPQSRLETWRRYCQFAGLWPLLGYGYWAILDRASERMIGTGGLAFFERGIDALEGFPEIGYALNADWWDRGLASEFAIAVMHWSDRVLAAPEVRAVVAPCNAASIGVLAKVGFTCLGPVEASAPALLFARARAVERPA